MSDLFADLAALAALADDWEVTLRAGPGLQWTLVLEGPDVLDDDDDDERAFFVYKGDTLADTLAAAARGAR